MGKKREPSTIPGSLFRRTKAQPPPEHRDGFELRHFPRDVYGVVGETYAESYLSGHREAVVRGLSTDGERRLVDVTKRIFCLPWFKEVRIKG